MSLVSAATRRIPEVFRRFYSQLKLGREQSTVSRRDLYSIDRVTPGERFSTTVRIVVDASGVTPSIAEIDLGEWRPEHELDDRIDVRLAASKFVLGLSVARTAGDHAAYAAVLLLAPEFLKDFTRRDGLAVERFYREALSRVGEVRSDRRTTSVLGSLFLRDNVRRLVEVLSYGLRSTAEVDDIISGCLRVFRVGA